MLTSWKCFRSRFFVTLPTPAPQSVKKIKQNVFEYQRKAMLWTRKKLICPLLLYLTYPERWESITKSHLGQLWGNKKQIIPKATKCLFCVKRSPRMSTRNSLLSFTSRPLTCPYPPNTPSTDASTFCNRSPSTYAKILN